MASDPNKLSKFWQELKRRKVIKVIAMYAATAFIIMEAGDIMLPRLGLPDWTVTFIIILLIVGFPIAIILSWIFDVTPEGIKKTDATEATSVPDQIPSSTKRGVKSSDVIIAVLFITVCILIYPKIFNKGKFEEIREDDGRISLAVVPFKNTTGDSLNNWYSEVISSMLINALSQSHEISVINDHSMLEILASGENIQLASMSTSMVDDLVSGIQVKSYIWGDFIVISVCQKTFK